MKKKSQTELTKQPSYEDQPSIASKEMEELLLLKSQLREIKQRNEQFQAEIKNITQSNLMKKHTNNGLRQTFKKLYEEIEALKQEHLSKVEQNLKNQEGPVSALIKENGFGLSPFALMKLPTFRYQKKPDSDICMGCYQQLQQNAKCKSLPGCNHVFHAQCIDQYLLVSKQCPGCGQEVVV